MSFNIEAEKRKYCAIVKIGRDTYSNNHKMVKRTRAIFGTFTRVLKGRSTLSKKQKKAEMENLSRVVQREIIYPILRKPAAISNSQAQFDEWHRRTVNRVKKESPLCWGKGSCLTVGMAQKILNLHCKDIWALGLVPERYSRFFHSIIDRVTLEILGKTFPWTQLESYAEYMKLQFDFRQRARDNNIYPLALECPIWNNYSKKKRSVSPR